MLEAILEPDVISYSAGIGARERGEQRQRKRALALLSGMLEAKLAGQNVSARLALLSEMLEAILEPDVISYRAGIICASVLGTALVRPLRGSWRTCASTWRWRS